MPAKPRRERNYPQAMRVYGANFPEHLEQFFKAEKCVIPNSDVEKLRRRYYNLFRRYKRLKFLWFRREKYTQDTILDTEGGRDE